MPYKHLCTPSDHLLSRRRVLGGMVGAAAGVAGVGGVGALLRPVTAEELKKNDRQVVVIWLDGGMSQLETWDPKPNTRYGGPLRSIQTATPGLHFCETMPRLSRLTKKLSVVRNMKTEDPNHSSGVPKILRGQPKERGVLYPYFGSAVAKLLGPMESQLPPYVWVKPGSGGFISKHAGFLGAQYGALALGDGQPPTNLLRPESLSSDSELARRELQAKFNRRYAGQHRPQWNEANSYVYDVAHKLMEHVDLFDDSTLDEKDVERYGRHEIGRHTLLARRLLEAGVRFVQVSSNGWDTHGDNFNEHATRVPKVDQAVASLIEDLDDRSMLDNVLVVVMAEFGRTPRINGSVGRDHWNIAWSLAMTGAGIQRGVVVGETNAEGTDVVGDPFDIGHMFHTWYAALGIPKATEYMNGVQPLPIAHDDYGPVKELLS
ncbi:DUF1501 domain-containing protein [Lignipirellula cremea]|uniref:DUF1501 domain-containing protein n=1 Tax=Lignipirellula cremea TaxID=2528010 RepID=A0A518DVA8_9BACT|nr:DUF1501 domain-containing protein [Lignipirellula cremea]QDU95769.1 hypothetical protein Pla8534_35860 [Lignipirellula cremea]